MYSQNRACPQIWCIDASLKKFNAASASYLLNTKQRQEISDRLISNTNYLEMFHLTQDRLLTCGTNIMFHYSLLTLENKSQNIATFIKLASNQEQLELKNKNDDWYRKFEKNNKYRK